MSARDLLKVLEQSIVGNVDIGIREAQIREIVNLERRRIPGAAGCRERRSSISGHRKSDGRENGHKGA